MWWDKKRIALLAAALLLVLTGCASESAEAGSSLLTDAGTAPIKNRKTYEVQLETVTKAGRLTVTPTYTQQQTLYAPENELFLDQVLVSRGDQVKKGDPLVTFRRRNSQAELERAELAVSRAKEDQAEWLEDLEDAVDDAGYVGGIELKLAQLEYDRAVYTCQRQLKELEETLEKTREAFEIVPLTAPYDCVIGSVSYLHDREEVDKSSPILNVNRASSLVLVGEESIAGTFQYGNEVTVEYGKKNNRRTVSGRVVSTAALLEKDDSKMVCIVPAEPVEEDELIDPIATIDVLQAKDILTVPRSAISMDAGSSYVQILVDGIPHKRYILRGAALGSVKESCVMVLAGLEVGQLIIME